jgi:hypothetical protein
VITPLPLLAGHQYLGGYKKLLTQARHQITIWHSNRKKDLALTWQKQLDLSRAMLSDEKFQFMMDEVDEEVETLHDDMDQGCPFIEKERGSARAMEV